ncbi:MAG: hypothetical protein ACOC6S_02655 [Chloroflexota bacterium]
MIASDLAGRQSKSLDKCTSETYNRRMQTLETELETLFTSQPDLIRAFQRLGWGRIEIVVKDGKPVMISMKRDIKLD